jgi:hypothetical protein
MLMEKSDMYGIVMADNDITGYQWLGMMNPQDSGWQRKEKST